MRFLDYVNETFQLIDMILSRTESGEHPVLSVSMLSRVNLRSEQPVGGGGGSGSTIRGGEGLRDSN